MIKLIAIAAVLSASLAEATPLEIERCRSLSRGLQDMRYYQGKTLKPGDYTNKAVNARIARCGVIAKAAAPYGTAVVWASIALAFKESCFDFERRGEPIKGKAGEVGPMQVMAKTCAQFENLYKDDVCLDPIKASVLHMRNKLADAKAVRCKGKKGVLREQCLIKTRSDDLQLALSYYNGTRGGITNYGKEVAGWAIHAIKRHRKWLTKQRKQSGGS